jgi:UDP-hydrolysing UDP-N-acetyl-D-glucosamine 2-epimerase
LTKAKKIAVWTGGRADYGILRSSILGLTADPRFELRVWAGGSHLSIEHGSTVDYLRADGVDPSILLDGLSAGERPAAVLARTIEGIERALRQDAPDAVMVLGDRYETLGVATLCAAEGVPLVHLHGGEETEGAVDNACRHAITKLAHLHLVSHPMHASRVVQMGESPESVRVVGAAGLDNLLRSDLPDRASLERSIGGVLGKPLVLVTVHPATLGDPGADPLAEVEAVAWAMDAVPATYLVTQANADPGGAHIRAFWREHCRSRRDRLLVDALGQSRFWATLKIADAVLGNSSAGLIEAPAVGLPVIDVGVRQAGRLRSAHVTTVPADGPSIAAALRRALDPASRNALRDVAPLYGVGAVAPRIIEALANWHIPKPARKSFVSII